MNNNKQPKNKGFGNFLKHYFGYILLAIVCSCIVMLLVGYVGQ